MPFLREILDRLADPWCREVVLCKPAQIGGTTLFENAIAYRAAEVPGPAMLFLADEGTAIKISRTRIQPMMRDTESLARLIVEGSFTLGEIMLANGYNLELGWSSSIAKSASRAVRDLFLDEIDKPGYNIVGEEGSTLHRLRQRTETWADHKIYLSSTPTTEAGNITKELNSCHVIYDWHVPCPQCGAYQPLRWQPTKYHDEHGNERTSGSVCWPGGHEATEAQIGEARYQCGECHGQWGTPEKNNAVERGRWIARGANPARPSKVGYHLNRLYSLFPGGRLSSLVRGWLEAQTDLLMLRSYVNSVLAEPWVDRVESRTIDRILAARCDLPIMTLPSEPVAIIAGVDMQQSGFWCRFRAFANDKTSWGLYETFVPDWDQLTHVLFDSDFPAPVGPAQRVWRVMIDTGGTKELGATISRTEEAYAWIAAHKHRCPGRVFGCKGSAGAMPTALKIGRPLEKMPSGKAITGGIQLVQVNTDLMKDEVFARIDAAADRAERGGAWLHAATDDRYAKQIVAEEKQLVKGKPQWVVVARDNHYLDAEVLCFTGANRELWGGVQALRFDRMADKPKPAPVQDRPGADRAPSSGNPHLRGTIGGWFGGTRR